MAFCSTARPLLDRAPDGRLKLLVTRTLLRFRRSRPELFDRGSYLALDVRGPLRHHVVAFARRRGPDWIVVAVPRLPLTVAGGGRMPVGPDLWAGTSVVLPEACPSDLVDVVTGRRCSSRRRRLGLDELFATLPLSVLTVP